MAETQKSGLGLDNSKLSGLLAPHKKTQTHPSVIKLELIDEDATQPRTESNPGFSQESLRELAETIKERGVKSPISVRVNPTNPKRFIINHGARRYRASKIAEMVDIPAFVDEDYNAVDQVIENIHREELSAREIADFIGRQKSEGKKGTEIASLLGKSTAWVSQYGALLNLPEWLEDAFNKGSLSDVTLINDILKFLKKHKCKEEVMEWLETETDINRKTFKVFCEVYTTEEKTDFSTSKPQIDQQSIVDMSMPSAESVENSVKETEVEKPVEPVNLVRPVSQEIAEEKANQRPPEKADREEEADPKKLKKAIIFGVYRDRIIRLQQNIRPDMPGFIVIKYEDDGNEAEVPAVEIKLTAIREA